MQIEQLKDSEVLIDTKTRTTIRELEPGVYFIASRHLKRHGMRGLTRAIRRRTEDPFNSTTVLGTRIGTYPSDRVYPVSIQDKPTT